jgi:hypothetical protein
VSSDPTDDPATYSAVYDARTAWEPTPVLRDELAALYEQNPDSPCWEITHIGRPCGPDCLAFTLGRVGQRR